MFILKICFMLLCNILIIRASFIENAPEISEYCKYDEANTPCKTSCAKAKSCRNFQYTQLTAAEKYEILDYHNQYRDDTAGGLYENRHLPSASNMHVLSYDKEAEFSVMCWMIQCLPSGHDEVRIKADGTTMGQNLYTYINARKDKIYHPEKKLHLHAIDRFFEETRFLTHKNQMVVKCDPNIMHDIGHLTALLWAKTKYVGCAKMIWPDDERWYYHLGCNYHPEGNDMRKNVYSEGNPASNCSRGVLSNNLYRNLCGVQRPSVDDMYVTPFGDYIISAEPVTRALDTGARKLSVSGKTNRNIKAEIKNFLQRRSNA